MNDDKKLFRSAVITAPDDSSRRASCAVRSPRVRKFDNHKIYDANCIKILNWPTIGTCAFLVWLLDSIDDYSRVGNNAE